MSKLTDFNADRDSLRAVVNRIEVERRVALGTAALGGSVKAALSCDPAAAASQRKRPDSEVGAAVQDALLDDFRVTAFVIDVKAHNFRITLRGAVQNASEGAVTAIDKLVVK